MTERYQPCAMAEEFSGLTRFRRLNIMAALVPRSGHQSPIHYTHCSIGLLLYMLCPGQLPLITFQLIMAVSISPMCAPLYISRLSLPASLHTTELVFSAPLRLFTSMMYIYPLSVPLQASVFFFFIHIISLNVFIHKV